MRLWIALLLVGCGAEKPDDSTTRSTSPVAGQTPGGAAGGSPSGTSTDSCRDPVGIVIGSGAESVNPVSEGGPFPVEKRGGNYYLLPVAGALAGVGTIVTVTGGATEAATGDPIAEIETTSVGVVDHDAARCTGVIYGVPAVIDLPEIVNSALIPCEVDSMVLDLTVTVTDVAGCGGKSCGEVTEIIQVVADADTKGCP